MRTLHISVSQLRQYLRCPRQFELIRVRGVAPSFTPTPLAFGVAIHEGLAAFYVEQQRGGGAALEKALESFEAAWRRADYGEPPLRLNEGETWDAILARGKIMLRAFVAGQPSAAQVVVAVEQPFEVDVHDPVTGIVLDEKLVGTIDAVVREGDRTILLEHKTSARRYTEDQLRFDIQVTAYKLAARQLGLGDVSLRYQVITKAERPAVQLASVDRDAGDEFDFLAMTVGVLRAIDGGAFFPIRGWQCRTCPVAYRCSGHR